MLKNPFSFYDFLGYLFPGLLFVMFIKMVSSIDNSISSFSILNAGISDLFTLNDTIPLTVLAYICGHFISYFSSLTVESFLVWSYGYPSVFLLKDNSDKNFFEVNEKIGYIWTIIWKSLVCIIIFPICIASLIFGRIMRFRFYVLKPLDSFLVSGINKKMNALIQKLGLSNYEEGKDIHRIVMHYCYENYKNHIYKYDNYVALYGFLRSLTFLFNCMFIYFFISEIRTISLDAEINWFAIIFLCIFFLVVYIFYLGFIKFYRRYTLENFMSLMVDENIKDEIPPKKIFL